MNKKNEKITEEYFKEMQQIDYTKSDRIQATYFQKIFTLGKKVL